MFYLSPLHFLYILHLSVSWWGGPFPSCLGHCYLFKAAGYSIEWVLFVVLLAVYGYDVLLRNSWVTSSSIRHSPKMWYLDSTHDKPNVWPAKRWVILARCCPKMCHLDSTHDKNPIMMQPFLYYETCWKMPNLCTLVAHFWFVWVRLFPYTCH